VTPDISVTAAQSVAW